MLGCLQNLTRTVVRLTSNPHKFVMLDKKLNVTFYTG